MLWFLNSIDWLIGLTPLSTLSCCFMAVIFYRWMKPGCPERITDLWYENPRQLILESSDLTFVGFKQFTTTVLICYIIIVGLLRPLSHQGISFKTCLYIFCETSEDLFGNHDSSTETFFTRLVYGVFTRVMPVKVHDGLLQSQ